jgi:hypothetical protein
MPSPEFGAGPGSIPTLSLNRLSLEISLLDSGVGHPIVKTIAPIISNRKRVIIKPNILLNYRTSFLRNHS